MALVEQLRVEVVVCCLLRIWHWYLPLCIFINKLLFLIFGCFYCFCPFLFIFLFSLVLINWMEWSAIPAHPSLYVL